MLLYHRPSAATVRRFLEAQARLDFSYATVGATRGQIPAGYAVDHTRVKLGTGKDVFAAARSALTRWDQFRLSWLQALPPEVPIREGEVVAIASHTLGLWMLHPCRIVYVIDESAPNHRFGFAYGTLPDHAETGEERFLIEWDRLDDQVYYDILAFSRPKHLLTRLGYRYVRRLQKRFGRQSAAAMQTAVDLVVLRAEQHPTPKRLD